MTALQTEMNCPFRSALTSPSVRARHAADVNRSVTPHSCKQFEDKNTPTARRPPSQEKHQRRTAKTGWKTQTKREVVKQKREARRGKEGETEG